jgi:hypothetical protein
VTIPLLALFLFFAAPSPADPPKVSADLGTCSADFHVTDAAAKPVYNARIHTLIRSGAFAIRKLELEVSTDSDGRASITNLPEVPKRPITFDISSGAMTSSVAFEPDKQCRAKYEVGLK